MEYVTVTARGALLSRNAAEKLVRRFLRRRGRLWLGMSTDAFTARRTALFIFRPSAALADWAAPIIYKLFTE